jgi:hypothetical protein
MVTIPKMKDMLRLALNDYSGSVYKSEYLDFVLKNSIKTVYELLSHDVLQKYKRFKLYTLYTYVKGISRAVITIEDVRYIDDIFLLKDGNLSPIPKRDASTFSGEIGWNKYLQVGEGNIFYTLAGNEVYVFHGKELPSNQIAVIYYDMSEVYNQGNVDEEYANFIIELAASHIMANDGDIRSSESLYEKVISKIKSLIEIKKYDSFLMDKGEYDGKEE